MARSARLQQRLGVLGVGVESAQTLEVEAKVDRGGIECVDDVLQRDPNQTLRELALNAPVASSIGSRERIVCHGAATAQVVDLRDAGAQNRVP